MAAEGGVMFGQVYSMGDQDESVDARGKNLGCSGAEG
jgi:hypothetical protein